MINSWNRFNKSNNDLNIEKELKDIFSKVETFTLDFQDIGDVEYKIYPGDQRDSAYKYKPGVTNLDMFIKSTNNHISYYKIVKNNVDNIDICVDCIVNANDSTLLGNNNIELFDDISVLLKRLDSDNIKFTIEIGYKISVKCYFKLKIN